MTAARDIIAAAIWERQNPGRKYPAHDPQWVADAEADADAVLAVILPSEKTRAQIDAVTAKRDAMPPEERQRFEAGDAPYLRIQLGCMLERAQQAEAARPVQLEQQLAAMTKLAAAWQKEAERNRRDLATAANPEDVAELRLWGAAGRALTQEEVTEQLALLRNLRMLTAEAIHIAADVTAEAKKRVTDLHRPVTLMSMACCDECSTERRTGPNASERIAYIPHPCRTIQALNGES